MSPEKNLQKKTMSDEEFIRALDKSILEGTAEKDPSLGSDNSLQAYLIERYETAGGLRFGPEPRYRV